jgi:predicted RNA-binding protein YlxR (DUF448 family)
MNELDDLDVLINQRKEKVQLMKLDGDNSHKLIADLYGSPTHFITELLQNAEDEGAKNVSFELKDNELVFSHDATNLFNFSDIRAISNFGDNQEKKEKPNAIGRFGIGFKSVYSITDTPRIVSAEFDITIKDYNVPERTKGQKSEYFNGTKIILPFKNDETKRLKTFELISNELSNLNLNYLLFLTNIQTIKWQTPQNSGQYERQVNKKDKRYITLKSTEKTINYLLLEQCVSIENKNLSIKLAFQLDEANKRKIVACDKSPLFVFFPTKIETNLKFLVHAPFYTTPARENIKEGNNIITIEKDDRNDLLKKELGNLLSNSLHIFKRLNILNVDLLNVLPIEKKLCDRSEIYKELYNSLYNTLSLSENQFLPNTNGSFSSSKELMLLGNVDLAELLTPKQAKKLFGRSFWVSKEITNNKTQVLRDYLKNDLEIPEFNLTSFASMIDYHFMKAQSDKWIIKFYKTINKAPSLWKVGTNSSNDGILRNKPIIRIESNNVTEQVAPFDENGKPKVFLPKKEHSKYATVKSYIAKNKEARKFLEDLGLTTPDIFAEINEFILPKFKSGNAYEEYFQDIKKVIEAYQSQNQEKRKRLIQDLKECPFILGYNPTTREEKHLNYNSIYFSNELLQSYFKDNTEVYYVAEERYSFNQKGHSQFITLLKEVGVIEIPRKIQISEPSYLSFEDKIKLRAKSNLPKCTWDKVTDFYLDGLNFFIDNISLERSLSLWNILSSITDDYFYGKYEWTNYNSYVRSTNFPAKYIEVLKKTPWLYDKDGNQVTASQISVEQLNEVYSIQNRRSGIIFLFDFKPDEIKAIEEKTGGKFLSKEEYENYQKLLAEQGKGTKIEKDIPVEYELKFEPDLEPSKVEVKSRELETSDINIDFHTSQDNTTPSNETQENQESYNNFLGKQIVQENKPKVSQKILNDIGSWGQDYVSIDLKNEFSNDKEIIIDDLNENGKKGVGADFIVKRGNDIIRIVEVKSTTEAFGQILSISGTQWEVARNYFKENNGNKYWIYCVFNAGKKDAEIVKIKNPIQKWKDGILLAHPVNFIVK